MQLGEVQRSHVFSPKYALAFYPTPKLYASENLPCEQIMPAAWNNITIHTFIFTSLLPFP